MQHDAFGQPTRLNDSGALTEWNATMMAFLAHGAATPTHLAATLTAAPDFALGHAVKGLFLVLLGRRELMEQARDAHVAATASLRGADASDARSDAFVTALGACLRGQMNHAVAALETLLARSPGDALAMKLSHAIRFVLGDGPGMLRSLNRIAPAYGNDHAARGYFLGCRAFALEEAGSYDAAVASGEAALECSGDDAWGLHAVTHVHDMTGRSAHGLAWMSGREDAWAHCNNFRYHVWWHKALLLLDLGRIGDVLALYDDHIRADRTDDYRDISNAASLLMRLELEGVAVGARWAELADLSENRTRDGCLVFADLHYLLALIGDGRGPATHDLMRRMQADARGAGDEMARRMARPGLSAAAGLEAFGAGDYGTAFLNLAGVRSDMQLAGGSHAQRDVFERLTIDSGIRAGHLNAAEAILDDRVARRAGRDDAYTAARRDLIAAGRGSASPTPIAVGAVAAG